MNTPKRGALSAIRRLAVDVTPLRRSRDFRLLWVGELISNIGTQVTVVAVFIQVFELTDSSAAVGLVGLVQLVGLVIATVLVSPLIDRIDRRNILIVTGVGQAAATLALLAGALAGDPPIVLVYAAAGVSGALAGVALSTRAAVTPNVVPRSLISSAMALNQVMFTTGLIVGPALGGIIVGRVGLAWAYGLDAASFATAIVATLVMSRQPPQRETAGQAQGWRSFVEGVSYLRDRPVLQTVFTVDLVAMIFGMPRALFPVLAIERFDAGEEVVGALFSAVAVGALLGALTTGWVRHVDRQGLAVIVAVAVWGAGIVAFGLVGASLWLAFACLAVAGAADVVSAVFRGTILQQSVPDDLRGRLSAVNILVVTGGPRLGDFEAGVVAALTSPTVSIVTGGAACIVGVVALSALVPSFARYRRPEPEPA